MLGDIIAARKLKLKKICERGVNPYPDASGRTHTIKMVGEDFVALQKEKGNVILAGRLRRMREHGGAIFADLEDASGTLQLYLKRDQVGADKFKFWQNFDLGDFIEASGNVFVTKKGEKTLLVQDFRLLAKAIRPLPEKWRGLQNQEIKYRRRYLDLLLDPKLRERFQKRAQICDALRDFLTERGFLEVETPVLQTKASGALARPFITHHEALGLDLYLRIAPETYLKRLIVGGFEKVFEMARVFRNEGIDTTHLQDFTLLEFYWAYQNYDFLMGITEEMLVYVLQRACGTLQITYQGQKIDFTPPWPRVTYTDLIQKDCGIDLQKMNSSAKLQSALRRKKIALAVEPTASYATLCDQLYKKVSRPKIIGPLFLTGHPIELSPLARRNDENPRIVDRFQLVVLGQELVNAYSELIDPQDQRQRFREQAQARAAGDQEAHMMDEDYVQAMEYGMPPMAGWGMGVDRLVMLLTDVPSIRDALFFPLLKPKEGEPRTARQNIVKQEESRKKKVTARIDPGVTRAQAWELVCKYVQNSNSRKHMLAAEAIMRRLAEHFKEDIEVWGLTGLVHDLDMEIVDYQKNPEKHGPTSSKILEKKGVNPIICAAVEAHNDKCGAKRETLMEKAIYAVDPLTGLIVAATLVLPSKNLADLSSASVLKRFREKSFAAGVRREVVQSCEEFGLSLEEFVKVGLEAMQSIAADLEL